MVGIVHTDRLFRCAEVATGIVVGCLPILPRFIKEYAPGRRTSLTTACRRNPSFLTNLCTKIANRKVLRKDFNTSNSFTETRDPRIHSPHFKLPQMPAQTYNNNFVGTSRVTGSYEGKNENLIDERDERYMRLDSVERGEPVRKRSLIRSETRAL